MTTETATAPVVADRHSAFELAYRQAKALCSASLVPQQYRDNVPNTMLAMEVANRIGASPFAVMQNLHIIQGKPSLSSSFLIATVNASGRFDALRFDTEGDDASTKTFRCRAFAKDRASGDVCFGEWITWKMVDAEGWSKKAGSKWLTMPGQMFRYRAAAFWARLYAPEISLGIHTAEEVQDVWGGAPAVEIHAPANAPGSIGALKQQLLGQDPDAPLALTFEEVDAALRAATTRDAIDEAADRIRLVADAEDRGLLGETYEELRQGLE